MNKSTIRIYIIYPCHAPRLIGGRGVNFPAYINLHRVREAIHILSDPEKDPLTVDAVAAACGFANRISFSRAFNNLTSLSPTQFRANRQTTKKYVP